MAYLIYVTDAGRFRFDNKGVSRNASMSLKFKENLLRLSILVREFNIPLIYGKIGGEYIKCKEPAKYNIHHSYRTVFTHFRYRFGGQFEIVISRQNGIWHQIAHLIILVQLDSAKPPCWSIESTKLKKTTSKVINACHESGTGRWPIATTQNQSSIWTDT